MADAVTTYRSMLAWFKMDLPSVSDQLALQALALGGRQFCIDTELYVKELDPIDIVDGTRTYSLSSLIPDETAIIRVNGIKYGSDATDDTTADYDTDYYSLINEDTIKFNDAPDENITDGLVVTVALRPIVSSKALAANYNFFDRYFDAVQAYAKYHLLRMDKDKGWADRTRANDFKREYDSLLGKYRRERFQQFKSGDIHVAHVKGRFV